MKITFHGATREVTGSCHEVANRRGSILLDCGMFQGGDERHERNRKPFAFAATDLRAVVLSHAHIDHSGRLPLLVGRGFRGPIFATEPTIELCRILLTDAGRIQEEDARWKIKRLRKKHEDWRWVKPLFTEAEALDVMERFVPVEFDTPHEVDGFGRVTFVKAGHILGAAIVRLELEDGGARRTLTFSGDLGVHGARLLGAPERVACPEHLVIESTYGDRNRAEEGDRTELLYQIVRRTIERNGKVVVPAFSVGRTQEVLARLNDLIEAGRLPGLDVFVDSPMAISATKVFAGHPEAYSETAQDLLARGDDPLVFKGLHFTSSVEQSKAINDVRGPCVIMAGSGMCTAGRIKHHLSRYVTDKRHTILFVGYQARGSLGRQIQSGESPVRIYGEKLPVEAEIATIEGFSAHADRDELIEWFGALGGVPKRTAVVHGEEESALSLAKALEERYKAPVAVPREGEGFALD